MTANISSTPQDAPKDTPLTELLDVMTPAEHDVCCEFLCDDSGEAVEATDCDCFVYQIRQARQAIEQKWRQTQLTAFEKEWALTGWLNHHRWQSHECLCAKCEDLRERLRSLTSPEPAHDKPTEEGV